MTFSRSAVAIAATGSIIATVVIAGTAAGAVSSKAPVPFTNTHLVVNKSIGGIYLGGKPSRSKKGFPKKDCTAAGCSYGSTSRGYQVNFIIAQRKVHSPKFVGRIEVVATKSSTPADVVRTSSGIGLNSTLKAFKKAYPHAKGNIEQGYQITGKAQRETSFYFSQGGKHVLDEIEMSNIHIG